MKVLVTGVKGQLGHDVVNELNKRGHEAVGVDIAEMDITDKLSVDTVISSVKPQAVIHCAAWTAVDAAEDNEDKVRAVNATGTKYIAEACRRRGVQGCRCKANVYLHRLCVRRTGHRTLAARLQGL